MHSACMATKTISLKLDAYERHRLARRRPDESFSQVVMRARWDTDTITGGELLERLRSSGSHFTAAELDRIESTKSADRPPEDKWNRR